MMQTIEFTKQTIADLLHEGYKSNYMHDRKHVEWRLQYIITKFDRSQDVEELAENLRYYGFIVDSQANRMLKGLSWEWKN